MFLSTILLQKLYHMTQWRQHVTAAYYVPGSVLGIGNTNIDSYWAFPVRQGGKTQNPVITRQCEKCCIM